MRFIETCAIITGVVDATGTPMVAVMNDGLAEQRVQHSIPLIRREGGWTGISPDKVLPFLTAGIAPIGAGDDRFSLVGWAGQAIATSELIGAREGLFRDDGAPSTLRSAHSVAGFPHAVGLRRRVFRRVADGRWDSLWSIAAEDGGDALVGFEAIDGFGTDELYAAGAGGDLWLSLHDRWEKMDSPTNVHLHAVICTPDGAVYAGGRMGVLLEGRGRHWRVVESGIEDTIWALCWFAGTLYVFSEDGVYRRSGPTLEQVESDLVRGGGFYHVSRSRDRMWCFARKRIVIFDGKTWQSESCELAEPVDADLIAFFNDDVLRDGSPYLADD